jgi:hypothetical protein
MAPSTKTLEGVAAALEVAIGVSALQEPAFLGPSIQGIRTSLARFRKQAGDSPSSEEELRAEARTAIGPFVMLIEKHGSAVYQARGPLQKALLLTPVFGYMLAGTAARTRYSCILEVSGNLRIILEEEFGGEAAIAAGSETPRGAHPEIFMLDDDDLDLEDEEYDEGIASEPGQPTESEAAAMTDPYESGPVTPRHWSEYILGYADGFAGSGLTLSAVLIVTRALCCWPCCNWRSGFTVGSFHYVAVPDRRIIADSHDDRYGCERCCYRSWRVRILCRWLGFVGAFCGFRNCILLSRRMGDSDAAARSDTVGQEAC